MYFLPNLYDAENHLKPVTMDVLTLCEDECTFRGNSACDITIKEVCELLMEEMQLVFPTSNRDLCDLYITLRQEIRNELFYN